MALHARRSRGERLLSVEIARGHERSDKRVGWDAARVITKSGRAAHTIGTRITGAHAEDAFIAELSAGVASRCSDGAERQLVRVLAADLLDFNPELAYPWGTLNVEGWLRVPPQLSQQRGIGRARVDALRHEVLAWLLRTERVSRRDARLMCRNVGATTTIERSIAA